MAMNDINGEDFKVGDHLKVIKRGMYFSVGTVLVCINDDGTDICEFCEVGGDPEEDARWVSNRTLQKL